MAIDGKSTPHQSGPPQMQQSPSQPRLPLDGWKKLKKNKPKHQNASSPELSRPAAIQGQQPNTIPRTPEVSVPAQNTGPNMTVARTLNQSAAVCDRVTTRLNDVLSRLDGEQPRKEEIEAISRGLDHTRVNDNSDTGTSVVIGTTIDDGAQGGIINFKKTWCYANSRLPPHVPPVKVYTETWPILCRAAYAADTVYSKSRRRHDEKEDYVDADWRHGTKAMVLKSTPIDDRNLIILAIRGSKWNLADWAVNFRPAPMQPEGFLDDEGNACHSGFLQVARAMIRPIAARLRELLEQDPSRASSSLVLTGHSAGGAVASLLYMHMLSTTFESELNILTGCFRRVHCITFGAPPVSLLPMQKPKNKRFSSSIFMGFANEGDPVVRADREYLSTLARVVTAPAPIVHKSALRGLKQKMSRQKLNENNSEPSIPTSQPPYCFVPEAALSNAGRLVLLRTKPSKPQTVEAVSMDDSRLRQLIFGDPSMHAMTLYRQRIDELAIAAVTGREQS